MHIVHIITLTFVVLSSTIQGISSEDRLKRVSKQSFYLREDEAAMQAPEANELASSFLHTAERDTRAYVECPPWFQPVTQSSDGTNATGCSCTTSLRNIVKCRESPQEISILAGYCMSFDEVEGTIVVGACPYTYFSSSIEAMFVPLPDNLSEVNVFCNSLNREDIFCGHCRNGYGISVFSDNLLCVKCTEKGQSLGWYIFGVFVLQTLFFFVVLLLHISATTASLKVFILFAHAISLSSGRLSVVQLVTSYNSSTRILELLKAAFALYRIWILDFFTIFFPHSCLDENLSGLSIIALGYVPAFYPLFLIAITFLCIELHDNNFKPFVWVWGPIRKCFIKIRKVWDLRTSVIHTFATCLVLSYSRVAYVSYSLLIPSQPYDSSGKQVGPRVWYYDATVQLFSKQHAPYAALAIAVLVIYVLLPPLLILVYPLKKFQKCLRRSRFRLQALHTFMDAFQGCYKNGTDGGRDCRYFAALYFFVILSFLTARLIVTTGQQAIQVAIFVLAAVIIAFFKPYRKTVYNTLDVFMLLLLAFLFFLFVLVIMYNAVGSWFLKPLVATMIVGGALPLFYFIFLLLYRIIVSIKLVGRIIKMLAPLLKLIKRPCNSSDDALNLPDRLVHPELYESLTSEMS